MDKEGTVHGHPGVRPGGACRRRRIQFDLDADHADAIRIVASPQAPAFVAPRYDRKRLRQPRGEDAVPRPRLLPVAERLAALR